MRGREGEPEKERERKKKSFDFREAEVIPNGLSHQGTINTFTCLTSESDGDIHYCRQVQPLQSSGNSSAPTTTGSDRLLSVLFFCLSIFLPFSFYFLFLSTNPKQSRSLYCVDTFRTFHDILCPFEPLIVQSLTTTCRLHYYRGETEFNRHKSFSSAPHEGRQRKDSCAREDNGLGFLFCIGPVGRSHLFVWASLTLWWLSGGRPISKFHARTHFLSIVMDWALFRRWTFLFFFVFLR